MSIESVMPSHHLILYHPLLLLPSIFPSIRFLFNESIRSFSFSISPSIAYSGLISFRIDWFDLLAVQKTLKSLQHHSLKASILWHSAFNIVQLLHPYMTIGKIIAAQGTSLGVQWLGLHVPNAGGPGSIPGQKTRSHRPQLKNSAHHN